MDTLNSYISDLSQQAPVPALKQLNQSSYLAGATEAPSPALLYPTMYGAERAGRAPEVKELQSHWNVYVGLHMPHSHTKYKHRHKHRHSLHARHGNGHGHHGNGHNHHDDHNHLDDGHSHHSNGHYQHADNHDNHSNSQDHHSNPDELHNSNQAEINGSGDGNELSGGRIHGNRSYSVVENSYSGNEFGGTARYKKSHSLPAGRPFQPVTYAGSQLEALNASTPSDPCDRVKFILGGDHDDQDEHYGDCGTHSIFTELEEFKYDENEHRMEWRETARWVKFEEDVEEGGDKWSKPHVATLSLHSLFELRSCIFKGTVLLDLQADNLAMISDLVLDNLVSTGQLEEDAREKVRAALLQRHLHLNSKKDHGEIKILDHFKSLSEIGRHNSKDFETALGNGNNGSILGSRNSSRRGSMLGEGGLKNGSITAGRMEDDVTDSEFAQHTKLDSNFMKKIPPGSEASNVLVGEVDFLSHPIIAFVRLAQSHYLGDLTEVPIPTRFIFIMLGPTGNQVRYHEIGRSIATLMSDEVFHEVAYKARNRGDLMAGIDEFLDKVTVLPPGGWDPQIRLEPPSKVPSQANRRNTIDPSKSIADVAAEPFRCKHCHTSKINAVPTNWSKRPFRGLTRDITRCYGLYRSDFSKAFNLQSVSSLHLIYFANIILAFTFGAFLSDHTDKALGATETILAVGIGNLIYAIFSGQPLVILGPTGPTLIFEQLVARFCSMEDIPFLEFRFWVGLWAAIFIFALVGLNLSAITRILTRFTVEIFTVLIGLVFIYEAFLALWKIHENYPYNRWILYPTIERECDCFEFPDESSYETSNVSNATKLGSFWSDSVSLRDNCSMALHRYVGQDCPRSLIEHHDVFLMSIILFFGTFLFCIYFKKIRNSRFLSSYIRVVLSDFAVLIAVVVWVIIDILAQVDTPKLAVPNVFENGIYSQKNRSFLINPLGHDLPSWAPGAALLPALMATILFFMDQHITAVIINKKDNRLTKQPGYHLDLLIIGCLLFLHSLLGLPWVVGATIMSISHVQSLFIYSPCTTPGEKPKFIGVREQRVTLFMMAVLVILSTMAYRVLKFLPLPVLYGLILYLGVASLYGVQFIERFFLFFSPNKHKPDFKYLRHIPNRRIHFYTGIQMLFLLLLCVFQVYFYLKVVFIFLVVALVIGRWLLGFVFSKHDLELLDDPIPDSLYCRPCQTKQSGKVLTELEIKGSLQDSLSNSGHLYQDNVQEDGFQEDGVVICEPLGMNGNYTSDSGGVVGSMVQQQPEASFNLTHEVDQCDLWRNMVKNLDAPLPSPQSKTIIGDVARVRVGTDDLWAHDDVDYRTLDTLEECDTDLESGLISATWEIGGDEANECLDSSKGASTLRTSSPAFSNSSQGNSRLWTYKVEDADYDQEMVDNAPGSSTKPVLLHYKTTPV